MGESCLDIEPALRYSSFSYPAMPCRRIHAGTSKLPLAEQSPRPMQGNIRGPRLFGHVSHGFPRTLRGAEAPAEPLPPFSHS